MTETTISSYLFAFFFALLSVSVSLTLSLVRLLWFVSCVFCIWLMLLLLWAVDRSLSWFSSGPNDRISPLFIHDVCCMAYGILTNTFIDRSKSEHEIGRNKASSNQKPCVWCLKSQVISILFKCCDCFNKNKS